MPKNLSGNTLILVLSLVAGVVGTGLGGVIGVLLKGKGTKVMGRVLSFAGGVMVGVVTFAMIPQSIESSIINGWKPSGVLLGVSTLVVGMIVIYGLNKVIDIVENMRATHKGLAELHHETAVLAVKNDELPNGKDATSGAAQSDEMKKRMLKAGIIMLLAIALHNFPEGMAIGASGAVQTSTGVLIAIIIAVHNIPEGMAIAAPLAEGGISDWKNIGLTTLAGFATVLGAVLGILIGGISAVASGICMGLAGGAMLYVTFCEILPQATLMEEGRVPAVSMLIGIICAMLFVYLF